MSAPITPLDPRVEMFQRGTPDAFFNMKALAPRPLSNATEMYDTEFEDDSSDIEEDYSPRISLNSAGRRSETTLSSYEELPTPKSNNFQGFDFELNNNGRRSVEGPKGPHLFYRTSSGSEIPEVEEGREEEYYLTMSPMTPGFAKTPTVNSRPETAFRVPPIPPKVPEAMLRPISTLTEAISRLNSKEVALWTPRQVARWMYGAGFEPSIVEKFEENDISGEILITLKFEDLRELDIQSFGQRHKLWNEIHNLRGDNNARPSSPTVIECGDSDDDHSPRRRTRRKHKKPSFEDIISPLESVSIVGIEQLMPKPHKCAKGEKCSKWRKQQRIIAEFNKEHPAGNFSGHPVSPKGGRILIAGDPGNPYTAEAARPFSDVQPSVVASSDVLGPGTVPTFGHLEESSLKNLQTRDPQDNVRQFLTFQHVDTSWAAEEPATPPYEMFPTLPPTPMQPMAPVAPHQNLRSLPKLAIPGLRPPPRSASAMAFSPGPMDRADALSPELRNAPGRSFNHSPPQQPYRFGTPASEMDVPVTAVNLGPICRDASQSVPPNMSYRQPIVRSASRSSRRPSCAILPRLDENRAAGVVPPRPSFSSGSPIKGPSERSADDVSHAGWMKKRKTKMLRHEWHEHHFTLQGTRLAMHKDERATDILESIDVDDYAIACSSLASGSKLNAAFKAMNIKLGNGDGKGKKDGTAFAFQLIPAAVEKGQKLRKRDSMMSGAGKLDTKTHHFAVKSRDDRIDWMRELMLAKALKQKGDGFEVTMNGNMI